MTGVPHSEDQAWCRSMLQRVSRTFALNIRLLDGDLRTAVQQAYLLCRIADTIEDDDTGVVQRPSRCLEDFAQLLPLSRATPQAVHDWQRAHLPHDLPDTADWQLVRQAPRVLRVATALPRSLQHPIDTCVQEMSRGMADIVARQRLDGRDDLHLESMQELESYCHVVAGTVGTLLCDLFLQECDGVTPGQATRMRSLAERFGLALQLVNILQDVRVDHRRRVHYIPRQLLLQAGATPADFLGIEQRQAWVRVLATLVQAALRACDAALEFSLLLPRRQVRVRLFCLWPLFLALRTLDAVLASVPSASQDRPRVPRRQVRRCLLRATACVFFDGALQRLYLSERRRVTQRLHRVAAAVGVSLDQPATGAGGRTWPSWGGQVSEIG